MKLIRISAKVPSIVWVDSQNQIVYAKGLKGKPDRLTYNMFREIYNNINNERIKITLPSGTIFKGPFRQLSETEIVSRLNEIN